MSSNYDKRPGTKYKTSGNKPNHDFCVKWVSHPKRTVKRLRNTASDS